MLSGSFLQRIRYRNVESAVQFPQTFGGFDASLMLHCSEIETRISNDKLLEEHFAKVIIITGVLVLQAGAEINCNIKKTEQEWVFYKILHYI